MRLQKITATEVVVPARAGAVNSAALERPLHKLGAKGRAAWTQQFDALPKLVLQLTWEGGLIGLGELYRDHDWDAVETIAASLLGKELDSLTLQALPIGLCREYDGFECAIWDSLAKAHGLPLVKLLGGAVQERVLVGAWTGHREVEEIMDHLGRWVGTDPATGFQLIEAADGRTIKIADLVDDDPAKRDRVSMALKSPAACAAPARRCESTAALS